MSNRFATLGKTLAADGESRELREIDTFAASGPNRTPEGIENLAEAASEPLEGHPQAASGNMQKVKKEKESKKKTLQQEPRGEASKLSIIGSAFVAFVLTALLIMGTWGRASVSAKNAPTKQVNRSAL